MTLNVIIIGAGLSGLTTAIGLARGGNKVTVFERRGDTNELSGNGVQLQPSGLKVLEKWGLLEGLKKYGHETFGMKFLRYTDGIEFADHYRAGPRKQYWALRNSLRKYLYETAKSGGATFHFDAEVKSIDFDAPSITLADGSTHTADVIVAADGSNSVVRRTMFPGSERTVLDDYAIQAVIPRAAMLEDEETRKFYEETKSTAWLGPSVWVLASIAPNEEVYDLQVIPKNFAHKDPQPDKLLQRLDDLSILGDTIDTWDPVLKKFISKGTSFLKWRLVQVPPLETALAPSKKVTLIGDAFHGMDPHAGYGATLAIEDGGTLSSVLNKASSASDLPHLLTIFDKLQLGRSSVIRPYSVLLGELFRMPDGADQQGRDAMFSKVDLNTITDDKPDPHAVTFTGPWRRWLDDYDAIDEVNEAVQQPKVSGKL